MLIWFEKMEGPLTIAGPPTRKSGWAMARPSHPVPTPMIRRDKRLKWTRLNWCSTYFACFVTATMFPFYENPHHITKLTVVGARRTVPTHTRSILRQCQIRHDSAPTPTAWTLPMTSSPSRPRGISDKSGHLSALIPTRRGRRGEGGMPGQNIHHTPQLIKHAVETNYLADTRCLLADKA